MGRCWRCTANGGRFYALLALGYLAILLVA
jgi:hypothetical protein